MEESIVKIQHLSHRYSIQWAVRDVSFEMPQRGIYGLLGSNGAGKSTLMNILCGILKQTEGDVYVAGVNIRRHPLAAKRHIGFLPQKPPLYGDLTVEEYLTMAADLRWIPVREVRKSVDEVLELCGISHFRNRLLKHLSGGYQQRVGIAQAIIHKPDLVVLDEPTNGLDPNQIVDIRHLIKGIAEERTVLLSTHILPEVQAACDHILMMEQGQLVFAGTIDEFDHYIEPNTIFLQLAEGPSPDVLRAVPGVAKLDELGDQCYRIHFTDAQEVIERIVEDSSRFRWGLLEIRQERSSLDEIFTKLSQKVADKSNQKRR